MRTILLVLALLLAGFISIGLFVAQLPAETFSISFNEREVEGLSRVLVAGVAGIVTLLSFAVMFLLAAFMLSGASILVAALFAGAGVFLIFAGLPFMAPLIVSSGLLYVAVRARRKARDARVSRSTFPMAS